VTVRNAAVRMLLITIGWSQPCWSSAAPPTSDLEQLRALHEKTMRAHKESNAEMLLEDQAADMVIVNRGAVTRPTPEERKASFGSYLGRTTFSEYRDLMEPIVTVSSDGSLGWVICHISARGVQTEQGKAKPIEFVSAWVELYQKRNGRWYGVGNVSNFRP
jgi:hypothetical protein